MDSHVEQKKRRSRSNSGSDNNNPRSSQDCIEERSLTKRTKVGDIKVRKLYRNHLHLNRTFGFMNEMRKGNLFCDVILEANDGSDIKAHKMILAASSSYFHARFTKFEDRNDDRIKIQDIDYPTLQLLVNYIYSAEIYLAEDNIRVLLAASNLLQLTDVFDACCQFIKTQFHPSNCLEIKKFAETHGYTKLMTQADLYIKHNFLNVIKNEEFLKLTSQQIIELISNDHLIVPSEEKIFECLMSWINSDIENRKNLLGELMQHVRFSLLSPEYLANRVCDEPLIKTNLQCQGFLNEAFRYNVLKNQKKSLPENSKIKNKTGRSKVILVVGGPKEANCSIECFDLDDKKWYQLEELKLGRCGSGLTVLDERIYLIGGTNNNTKLQTVSVYDHSMNIWSTCAEMNRCRTTFGVTILDHCIYVLGGFNGKTSLSSVEVYDPKFDKWRMVSPMNFQRSEVGVGVVNGYLYAVGGYDTILQEYLTSVERYNADKNKWKSVADIPGRRCGVGVGVLHGILYAVGGFDGISAVKSVIAYDCDTNQWNPIAPMSSCRSGAGVIVFDRKLYVIGGHDGLSHLSSVEVHSPKTNSWKTLDSSMNIPRRSAGIVIVDKSLAPPILTPDSEL